MTFHTDKQIRFVDLLYADRDNGRLQYRRLTSPTEYRRVTKDSIEWSGHPIDVEDRIVFPTSAFCDEWLEVWT